MRTKFTYPVIYKKPVRLLTSVMLAGLVSAGVHAQHVAPAAAPVPPPPPPAAPPAPEAADPTGLFFATKLAEGGRGGRSVVVRTSEADAQTIATAEEDLNIMSRLLEKAIASKSDDKVKSMGIDLQFLSGGTTPRNLYLEGYGAVFLLKVKFPLAPPPAKQETKAENAETSSAWDEARQELYGRQEIELDVQRHIRNALTPRTEPYDEKRVENLKQSLLETLRNASNMRQVGPEESLTVVVTSEPETTGDMFLRRMIVAAPQKHMQVQHQNAAPEHAARNEKVMVIRVKKADVDALAKGNLKLEDFSRRAKVLIY